jgi:hypothetical protein
MLAVAESYRLVQLHPRRIPAEIISLADSHTLTFFDEINAGKVGQVYAWLCL